MKSLNKIPLNPANETAQYVWNSPIGRLTTHITAQGVAGILFSRFPLEPGCPATQTIERETVTALPEAAPLRDAIEQHGLSLERWFTAYFNARDEDLAFPQIDWRGLAAFDRRVWELLMQVPFGETTTYGDLARIAGNPGAARAVGGAMRRNPLVLIVPCHRVLSSGSHGIRRLGGFSGGLPLKEYLLAHEAARTPIFSL